MPKLYTVQDEPNLLIFTCPGCGYGHPYWIGPSRDGVQKPIWTWNGSIDAPTFKPSLLVFGPPRCHSYVTDGKIQFLEDCDHQLKGQTVELPDIEGISEFATGGFIEGPGK